MHCYRDFPLLNKSFSAIDSYSLVFFRRLEAQSVREFVSRGLPLSSVFLSLSGSSCLLLRYFAVSQFVFRNKYTMEWDKKELEGGWDWLV